MQFMLLCCFDESRWTALSGNERDRIMNDYGQWIENNVSSGHYLAGGKLDGSRTATTVRERNGKAQITDGPFSETKEQIGGFHIIECRDREEAVGIARRLPTLPAGGTVEVRPMLRQHGPP
ncbi:MAG TPA: YciI family protein [Gammaproteobacteria bacterium]